MARRPRRGRIFSPHARHVARFGGFLLVLLVVALMLLLFNGCEAVAMAQPYRTGYVTDPPDPLEGIDELAVTVRGMDADVGNGHPAFVFTLEMTLGVWEIPSLIPGDGFEGETSATDPLPPQPATPTIRHLSVYASDVRAYRVPAPLLEPWIPGDLDFDGDVDAADMARLVSNWTGARDAQE
ncbi:MAG TPA: hypothetical protein VJ925_07905 [Longimicrobiales bacterium]|nr:hypothetical protein [Longimicrobiales bacterium]